MESLLSDMRADSKEAAKKYIFYNEIPQLFESLTAGLLHHKPEDPVSFVQDCLDSVRPAVVKAPKPNIRWSTFIDWTPPPESRTASRIAGATPSRSNTPRLTPRGKPAVQVANSNYNRLTHSRTSPEQKFARGTVSGNRTPLEGLSRQSASRDLTEEGNALNRNSETKTLTTPGQITTTNVNHQTEESKDQADSGETGSVQPASLTVAVDDITLEQAADFDQANLEPPNV